MLKRLVIYLIQLNEYLMLDYISLRIKDDYNKMKLCWFIIEFMNIVNHC